MKRHELDLTSLLCGLVFLTVAAAYLIAAATGRDVDGTWALPLTMVALGLAGIVASAGRAVRAARTRPQPTDAAGQDDSEQVR